MGTLLASIVADKASKLIQDITNVRWPLDEVLSWICSGQRQIVLVRPDACSETRVIELAAGSKQVIPTDAIRVLNVVRNQGQDGGTPGRAITMCQRAVLDSQIPDWHYANPRAEVKHFIYDEVEPRTWYCYPPQPTEGRGQALIVVSKSPAACTIKDVPKEDGSGNATVTSVISIDDIYENPLIDYTVYRCMSKDSEWADPARAQASYNAFLSALGLRSSSDKAFSAASNAPPRTNPNVVNPAGAFGQ